ncbi:aminotransferase [Cryobacterium sp. BB736]|uniref:aminotransferase n=1 Tax=Cryobacterium sp. BB736 TaxID=2746963 RepID=UPI001875EF41|nr:aminotransferase [Cryobacterium sp. BB736]
MSVSDFFDGQEPIRPDVTEAEAAELAEQLYGIVGAASEIGSNQDRNFRIDATTGLSAMSYLLKVDNHAFAAHELEAQNTAMAILAGRGLRVPVPIPGLDGSTVQTWASGDKTHSVRMMSFLDGKSLVDLGAFEPETIAALGRISGEVAQALTHFEAPGLERTLQWDLRNAQRVVEQLAPSVADDTMRGRVLGAAVEASARLSRVQNALRVQPIHGDVTDDNVLASTEPHLPDSVVDFGDLAHGWLVAELAVTVASILHHVPDDPLAAVVAIEAFDEQVPLTDEELTALWPLVVLRGAVLVVSGQYQLAVEGDNNYAADRTEHEWQAFEAAEGISYDEAESAIRAALGRPKRAALLDAISRGDVTMLDFSVTSPGLDGGLWQHPDAEWELAIKALGTSPVAVAPFGEYRLTKAVPNSRDETAVFATGWELFLAKGETLRSPIDAEVASVDGTTVILSGEGVAVLIDGLKPSVSAGSTVAAGDKLGRVAPVRDGYGRVAVQQLANPDATFPLFVTPSEAKELAPQDPAALIGLAPVNPKFDPEGEQLRRSRIFASAQERYYLKPPQIERGWKEFLVGGDGRVYLDMVNNVASIGHAHPRQVKAVARQLAMLNTNSRFLYRALADLSERLVELAPDPSLDTVLLVNSGTEAVDLALRLAQVHTGRRHVVALREGYHGWSMGADAITTSAYDNPSALSNRPDWVEIADVPNPYRGRYRGADSAPQYLADLAGGLERMVADDRHPAAFISEPVLGNAGGVVPPDGYLAGAYDLVRERGGLCIADEVQVGYGRLGHHFWGVQQQGVVPDIISVAKAMGNGYPLGAVITRREIAESLSREGNFFSSAGGSPVSSVAGLAVLDVIRDEKLQENAAQVGDHLVARLAELAERHPIIGAVHGMGLYLGIELVRDRETLEPATLETAALCERLLQLGVIMQPTSERQNVLKVKPPLCLSLDSADFFVDALDVALGSN